MLPLLLAGLSAVSLYGWGRLFARLFRLREARWAATASLGLAVVVFLGGMLNLLRVAYPLALAVVFAMGLVLWVPDWKRLFSVSREQVVPGVLILLVVAFTVATQLPPKAYNVFDDYQKYFPHAVRMVETGTVYGSPLSAIGTQTLGGQAFLQGFIVAFFPVAYTNGFDAVFGLLLCLMLAAAQSRAALAAVVCVLSVILIDPQVINVSAVYSAAVLVMVLSGLGNGADEEMPSTIAAGLACAALIALKSTFAGFVLFLLIFLTVVLGWRWGLRSALALAAFLSPWMLVHLPHYLAGLRAAPRVPVEVPAVEAESLNLFSFEPLDYGSNFASYTILLSALCLGIGFAWWTIRQRDASTPLPIHWTAACLSAGVATYALFLFLAPLQAGYAHAVRYFCPIAIGLAAPGFAVADRFRGPGWRRVVPVAIAALALSLFLPTLQKRIHQALTTGSILGFEWATTPVYAAYNRQVMYGDARRKVANMQRIVPAGEPIIAWMDIPLYLDFARNPILDVDTAGLNTRWSAMPAAKYLIWSYNGEVTEDEEDLERRQAGLDGALDRQIAARALLFYRKLQILTGRGQVLFDDGSCKVVRFPQ